MSPDPPDPARPLNSTFTSMASRCPSFPQLDKIVRGKFRYRQDLLLDLGREDIHPADDKHVIAAAGDLVHTAHGADTAGEEAGEVRVQ